MLTVLLSTLALAADPAADPSPTPPPAFTLTENMLVLPSPVAFEAGTAQVPASAEVALQHVRAYLEAKSYVSTLRIEGHVADEAPGAQALSEQRALTVARWLVAHGVACTRLLPVGFGATKPVASPSTPEGRAANTRVVFVNAGLRGMAIGGMPMDGGGKVAGDPCVVPTP